jgi:putative acyl-CoA dehydrogenase
VPHAAEVLAAEFAEASDARVTAFAAKLQPRMQAAERNDEARARALVRDMVLTLQAALLVKHAPPAVADAFCASRLAGEGSTAFGTLPKGCDTRALAERAAPQS